MSAAVRQRLARYVIEYNDAAWPDLPVPRPTEDDLLRMEDRADGWSDQHQITDGHAASCPYDAEECGLRSAAEEFVESV